MRLAAPRSFRGKLLLLLGLATSAGVIVACTTMGVMDLLEVKPTALSESSTNAAVIAANSAASLAFEDPAAGRETLSSLRALPNVISARLFDRSGALFSTYERSGEAHQAAEAPDTVGHRFDGQRLTIVTPVVHDGELLGTLVMEYDLSPQYSRLMNRAAIAMVVAVVSVGIALLLGMRLQRSLALQVGALMDTSQRITETKDYSLRVQRQNDDELGRLAESFNEMISTIEARDAELLSIQHALQESNEQLQQFAYVASHDLQEPLRMVASYMQLLQQRYADKLDDNAREFIGFAVDGALRMKQLINDLLDFSRVGTRGGAFVHTEAQVSLDSVLRDLQAVILESAAQITHDPLPAVTVDPTQFRQLLQNLIGNAIKFRGTAAPRIHLGVTSQRRNWVFSIRDNGIGIDPKFFDRIFVIFQRLHARDEYPGTGIGLAVCKKIVERHHGRIWVESTPGAGATFHFTLPKTQESAIPQRRAA